MVARLRRRCAARGRDQEGSALVLALLFTTIFSLFVASVVTFADAGLKSSKGLRVKRGVAFAADAAMEAAVNRFRGHNPCDDYPAPVGPDGQPLGGKALIVRCAKFGAEGPPNQPRQALLSLGTAGTTGGEQGIAATTANLRVRGDVFSNSDITSPSPPMVVEGAVSAVGNCTPNVRTDTSPPSPVQCADSPPAGDPVAGRDPDYTKALDSVPVRRTVPGCPTSPAWLVELQPGYYDDAAALSALTNGTCPGLATGLVVWMRPGNYYFDFGFAGGPNIWTINDPNVDILGGTPKVGLNPGDPRPALSSPGMCKVDGDAAPVDGIQLILGGQSRFDVSGGAAVELCAEPSTTEQEIALYGVPGDRPHTLEPSAFSGVDGFSGAANALVLGETPEATADANLTTSGQTAELTLAGYRPLIPPGSVIDSAKMRVRHEEPLTMGPVTVTPTFAGGGCTPAAVSLGLSPTMDTDVIDLKADCGLDDAGDLQAITVLYQVTAGGSPALARLDGIWIDVSYRTPVTRKPTAATTNNGFNAPVNAFEIGEVPAASADAALTDTPAVLTAAVTLEGFSDPVLPAGSVIDSATLRVAHHDEGMDKDRGDKVTVTADVATTLIVRDSESPACPEEVSATPATDGVCLHPGGSVEDRIDLSGLTLAQLAAIKVEYKAEIAAGEDNAATPHLDGIWLDLVVSPPPARTPATAASITPTPFQNPDNAKAIGEPLQTADASLDAALPASATATLTVSNFSSPSVPPGSVIDSAVLRVAHREDTAVNSLLATPTFTGSTCSSEPLTPTTTFTTDRLSDLVGCGLDSVDDLLGITVTYTASVGTGTGTAQLDGIELDLTFRPPSTYEADLVEPSPAPTGFVPDAAAAKDLDGTAADAPLTNPGTSTATVRLGGYGKVPLPPGSVIDAAYLRVAHRETGLVDALSAVVTPGVGPAITINSAPSPGCTELCINNSPVLVTDRIELKSKGFDTWDKLANLTVDYSATVSVVGAGNAQLDGIELDLVFRIPGIHALGGCMVATPYPTTGCAVVETDGSNSGTRFVVQGTVYTPSVPLDISMSGLQGQVLTRGLIARSIRLGLSSPFARPTSGVPPEAVRFTTYPRNHRLATTATTIGNFNPADKAKVIGEEPDPETADAALDFAGTNTERLELSDFSQPVLQEGASVDSVVLRIAHRETSSDVRVSVKLTFAGGSEIEKFSQPLSGACELCPNIGSDLVEDRIELTGVTAAQLANVTIEYTAMVVSGTGTAYLDGIELEVFADPLLRARAAFDPQGRVTVEGWSVLR